MDLTVDGGVQLQTPTAQDGDAAPRDLAVNRQEPLPAEGASLQIAVGEIPAEPAGFLPRADLLAELDRAGGRVTVIRAETGLRGVGTTQLAAAYARAKLAAGWRLVAWVNGADAGSLLAGLAAVADATGVADDASGPDIADAGQAVRDLLESDGDRCLLVFDDVANPDDLGPFIPAEGSSRVLITSTRQAAANLGTAVAIDVFNADEASAFLAARTSLDDEAGAAAVAGALGHLPLALALAAPVIAGRQLGYGWYLDQFQAMSADVSGNGDDDQPYSRAMLLSWQAVRAADQTGVCTRVMEIVAVLAAAGVRRELLHVAGQAGVLASGRRRAPASLVDRVLEWLSDRSLVTFSVDGQTVIMHRLVAQAIRDELARRQRWAPVCRATAFMLETYAVALARSQDRPAVRDSTKQMTALLDYAAALAEEVDEDLAESLLRLQFFALYHLIELGDSALQAIAVGEPLIAELERLLGPDHPETLNSRNSLAAAYLAVSRATEAIPLFEQTVAGRQRLLGPEHLDTLTSQNNLAAAYQDAGRTADAIPLFEQTLAVRERLLGAAHPSTLTSRGNLAGAYQDAGRAAEAIPLFEQTLAGREEVLGPDHPDTRRSRKHLANAYRDAGRAAEAIPLFEQISAGRRGVPGLDDPGTRTSRKRPASTHRIRVRPAEAIPPVEETRVAEASQSPADTSPVLPVGVRRPPADPASRVLPVGFRRPPAGPARRQFPDGVARLSPKPNDHPSIGRMQDPLPKDTHNDDQVVSAMRAGDAAGIAMAYDRYAAGLYGYCHRTVHDAADAAGALQDTFVIAVATISELPEPSQLRPWLYARARNECRRRTRTRPTTRDEEPRAVDPRADVVGQSPDAADWLMDATMPIRVVSQPAEATREAADVTMPIHVIGQRADAGGWLMDATMPIHVIGRPPDAAREALEATISMRAIGRPADAAREAMDATISMRMVSQPTDTTANETRLNDDREHVELRTLISSILAGLRPREREVIELTFRHGLYDTDLAIALGVSWSRAHALVSRAHGELEKALDALLIALTRRDACPMLTGVLAEWDGRLTKRTRNVIGLHVVQCQTCANHEHGALRSAAFSRLLPSAPLPPGLRAQVLSRCSSTAEDAVAYRESVAWRAEPTWFAEFSEAIRWNLDSIRAHVGAAVATCAVALWVVAAASVALLTVAGSNPAHAQPSVRISSSSPAAASVTTTVPAAGPTSASAGPSRTTRPSPTYVRPSYAVPTLRPELSPSPSSSPKPPRSPKPSNSPKPSKSPSASPSHSGSPSPSDSASSSPSPTA